MTQLGGPAPDRQLWPIVSAATRDRQDRAEVRRFSFFDYNKVRFDSNQIRRNYNYNMRI